ncbi:MAG: DUF86 domain-containing protein [Campylobacterota bacterium]|nr:DUF86 domain-containing protein [Campylobacterota bacterium]
MLHKIESKIIKIEKILELLEDIGKDCREKFLVDKIYQGALLHYLYLIADSCIVLAEMMIKYKNIPKSESYYQSIDLLGEYDIIPAQFAYDFAKIASFRNFLAHHYEKIDYKVVCEDTLDKLNDIKIYLKHIKRSLEN